MKHNLFTFTGEWRPIPEAELALYGTGVSTAPESFRVVLSDSAAVVIYRPSGCMDWYTLFLHNKNRRWYASRPGFPEVKLFAEKLAVGFSLFGESALRLPLP